MVNGLTLFALTSIASIILANRPRRISTSESTAPAPFSDDGMKRFLEAWCTTSFPMGSLLVGSPRNPNPIFTHHVKCEEDALFRIYSMSKPITSIAVLMLVEEGKISLSDPLSKYIPSFAKEKMSVLVKGTTAENPQTVPLETEITIHHLLTHTSGIAYGLWFGTGVHDKLLQKNSPNEAWKYFYTPMTLAELCELVARTPLAYQPGSAFLYGLSTTVVGHVVELVSGMTLDKFFAERIFQPLGMMDTFFTVPPEKVSRLVDCYEINPATASFVPSTNPERQRSVPHKLLDGGGGLVSSLEDYNKFCQCLIRKGAYLDQATGKHKQLLSSRLVDLMTTNHLPQNATVASFTFETSFSEGTGDALGFGYNVSVVLDPLKVSGGSLSGKGEYGWGGVASTYFYIDPVKEVYCIFMTQLIPSSVYPIRVHIRWLTHLLALNQKSQG